MLTEKALKALKPRDKLYRVADGQIPGLAVEISPSGGKRWRLRFVKDGKANMVSLGTYPEVSLAEARDKAIENRKSLREGDAIVTVRTMKTHKAVAGTFAELIDAWIENLHTENELTRQTILGHQRFFSYALKFDIGDKPLTEITSRTLLELSRKLEIETSHNITKRTMSLVMRVLHFALRKGFLDTVPYFKPQDVLGKAPTVVHRYALTDPREIPELLHYVDTYKTPTMRCFLQMMALCFCRSTELRLAKWTDIDWDNKLYRIPAERMKMRNDHLVPLSCQALALLEEQKTRTGDYDYIFCSRKNSPLSLCNASLIMRTGFKGRMTVHGFRSMASTLLNERGWNPDVIEAQLAHQDGNAVRRAYNRAQYLEDRRKMMQEWADYLDELRAKQA